MARRHRLITENPFDEVRHKAGAEKDRQRFITLADTAKLMEACPSVHWQVIVALSRYGGIRCPSEVLSLRWQDIDWAAGRVLVTSPKTEHHPGKDTRTIPLFPELRSILEEAFEAAPEGAVYVVDEKFRKAAMGPRGWRGCNLRTTMEKVIRRAGLTPWPRLFHNLRSSRETELAETFPIHVVTAWLGNTPEIARKHYLQVTEDHFRQASEAAQNAAQRASDDSGKCSQTPMVPETTSGQGGVDNSTTCHDLQPSAALCGAHVSRYQKTRNGEDRIRTCGGLTPSRI
jgi:integrase